MKYKGFNDNRITIEAGISNGLIGKGRKRGAISQENISKILYSYPEINANWLFTGNGKMLKDSEANNTVIPISLEETYPNEICLYDVSAAAGYNSFDEIVSKEKVVGKFIIPTFHDVSWMIFVRGSSMYPKYNSGDIIACRVIYESQFIQWGKVYVVATREQGILIKRLKKSDNKDNILAISDNPAYEPFDIPKEEILGIALVIGVVRLE